MFTLDSLRSLSALLDAHSRLTTTVAVCFTASALGCAPCQHHQFDRATSDPTNPAEATPPAVTQSSTPATDSTVALDHPVLAGFRSSRYGVTPFPTPDEWISVGDAMVSKLAGATSHATAPAGVWILGPIETLGDGHGACRLGFPGTPDPNRPYIRFAENDDNEAYLAAFDRAGVKVWLQVESGSADMLALIDLVLSRYRHHPSVIGFGIDVEWHHSTNPDAGRAITDDEARAWVAAIRVHNPAYTLMLKHWLPEKMPPTVRDGLFFLDDSQHLPTQAAMTTEFKVWGEHFFPAPVGFQIGYESDRHWWSQLPDPPADFGSQLLREIPNNRGIFWVDFTLRSVFFASPPT